MIVPSTKNSGRYSQFFLNIYFSCGEEEEDSTGLVYKYFSSRYINPYEGEDKICLHGSTIAEEDEDNTK